MGTLGLHLLGLPWDCGGRLREAPSPAPGTESVLRKAIISQRTILSAAHLAISLLGLVTPLLLSANSYCHRLSQPSGNVHCYSNCQVLLLIFPVRRQTPAGTLLLPSLLLGLTPAGGAQVLHLSPPGGPAVAHGTARDLPPARQPTALHQSDGCAQGQAAQTALTRHLTLDKFHFLREPQSPPLCMREMM